MCKFDILLENQSNKEKVKMINYGLKDKVALIQPEDIAETILFLSSKQARMITGQVIKVSGGKAL